MEPLTPSIISNVLEREFEVDRAAIADGSNSPPLDIMVVDIDLTTARTIENPYTIGFPFKSVFVRNATDSSVSIKLRPWSSDSLQGDITLKNNDSFLFGLSVARAFLSWGAQSGKTIQLIFSLRGEFRSGSQVSSTSGGVSISRGSAQSTSTFTFTAATATQIFSSNTTRKLGTWVNETGATVWIGPSTVTNSGSTKGVPVAPGQTLQWENSASLYGYSVAGSAVDQVKMEES